MKTIFMSETMRDKVSAMYEDEVTEACYRHYDSELRRENLTQPEIRAFFEAELQARPYLEGSTATGGPAGRFHSLSHWSMRFSHVQDKSFQTWSLDLYRKNLLV